MPACKQNRSTHPNPKLSDADEANGQRSLTVRIQLIAHEIERQVGPTTTRCPSASAVLLRNLELIAARRPLTLASGPSWLAARSPHS
jgi:hypothetical protein